MARENFKLAKGQVIAIDSATARESYDLVHEIAGPDFDLRFRSFGSSFIDLFEQLEKKIIRSGR